MHRHTYRLTLAYDGAPFWGFARQPEVPTVEGALTEILRSLIRARWKSLAVGGRTDRGVHATGQVVSFISFHPLDPARICEAVNTHPALAALHAARAPNWFHARFSAIARQYHYVLPDPARSYDSRKLQALLDPLRGRHCFTAFARDTKPGKSTVRTLDRVEVRRRNDAIHIFFAGNSFVRRQVRLMVGTALRAAEENAPDDTLLRMLHLKDRGVTGPSAPAEGLTLSKIVY